MVEANRNADAVLMISELAKLLRISLSKGKTIIRIADEIQHSKKAVPSYRSDMLSEISCNLLHSTLPSISEIKKLDFNAGSASWK